LSPTPTHRVSKGVSSSRSTSREEEQLFDYIEVFYNQQRRHSSIDYASPARYKRATRTAPVQAAA
jgi:transposase InsO family protein